jgi:hypothetical protein
VFLTCIDFKPSVIFVSKARAYSSGGSYGPHFLLTNIRLALKNSGDKHSSLLYRVISEEEKNCFTNLTPELSEFAPSISSPKKD